MSSTLITLLIGIGLGVLLTYGIEVFWLHTNFEDRPAEDKR